MFKKIIFISVSLLACAFTFAQTTGTIKGVVKDSLGTKVDFVSVVVEEDQKYNTLTDKNGAFELKVPANKKITLVFSSLNIIPYRGSIQVGANEIGVIDVVVKEKVNQE